MSLSFAFPDARTRLAGLRRALAPAPPRPHWREDVAWELRGEAVRAPRASEERYRAIVESSSDAIVSRALDGTITSWNAAAERLYGFSAAELIGTTGDRVLPAAEESTDDTERLRKDGTSVPVSITVSPIRDASGRRIGTAEVSRDLSSRRASDAERERLLARELEHLRSLDRVRDELIALVSHELRTPLTSIRGYLELVLDGAPGELSADQHRHLSVVARNADRLQSVVGDLLLVAEIAAGRLALEPGEVDLAEIAAEAVETGAPLARAAGIELGLAVEPGVRIEGDRVRLGQLLDNLVSNAIKFTPAGGRVDVRVTAADGRATLEIADTGMGIPAGEQPLLFERFFRSSNAVESSIPGTGLGLTISRAIAEAHGGGIELESVEGEGTTFRIDLPLAPAPRLVAHVESEQEAA